MRSAMRPIVIEGCATLQTWRCGAASGRRECAARKRGVNWTVSGGLVASGPGEVRLRCGQNRAENPDDAANCAGLTAEVVGRDDVYAPHNYSVHMLLPANRRGRQESSTEDDVEYKGRRDCAVLTRLNSLVCRLDSIDCHRQEDRQEATQHQEQLVGLLGAELGHGLSCLVALGHGVAAQTPPDDMGSGPVDRH